ncbi:MAG: DUF5597 domain-containing protein [Bacteroidota bacterium]|nr:DUF5597 domain-containing protein [Bacteroidota bacterium]
MQIIKNVFARLLQYISISCIICTLLSASGYSQNIQEGSVPKLVKQGISTQLIVKGKPFLMLAGELGNSNASSLDYLKLLWPKLSKMNLNTVLAPVYWEFIEPTEGKFDFALVDGLIEQARNNQMHLVLLWFGSWKNSMSCYTPLWVKKNQSRFPRIKTKAGITREILSPFSEENLKADIRAFSALMKHIKDIDEKENTVLMVQVENEIGLKPDARDYSTLAEKVYQNEVPAEVIKLLKTKRESLNPALRKLWEDAGAKESGSWAEVLGTGLYAEDMFMAWYYARYINKVAEAGKAIYPLPMYVNAELNRPERKPGEYSSGAPLPHSMDIWKHATPSIDIMSPDIYDPDFIGWTQKYDQPGNPLFIPEATLNPQTAVNAIYAIAQHKALGFSPFAIENADSTCSALMAGSYQLLNQLKDLILSKQNENIMAAALLDKDNPRKQAKIGKYMFEFAHDYTFKWSAGAKKTGPWPVTGGMVIQIAPDEFYVVGNGIIVTFSPAQANGELVGIGYVEEGKLINGRWIPGRRLNGDEDHQGQHVRIVESGIDIQRVKLYNYQ